MASKKDKVQDKDRFSIIVPKLDSCMICGTTENVMLHECFGGTANRKKSKEDGLVVPLCGMHHNLSNLGVHYNDALDTKLKQQAQRIWMKTYCPEDTEEDQVKAFIQRYGKNFI